MLTWLAGRCATTALAGLQFHHDLFCFAGVNPYRACGMPEPREAPTPTLNC